MSILEQMLLESHLRLLNFGTVTPLVFTPLQYDHNSLSSVQTVLMLQLLTGPQI